MDIRSQWKENWKAVEVVNSSYWMTPQFVNPVSIFNDICGLRLTVVGLHSVTVVFVGKNGIISRSELSMGWVDPSVGLVWVGLGRDFSVFGGLGWVNYSKSTKNM